MPRILTAVTAIALAAVAARATADSATGHAGATPDGQDDAVARAGAAMQALQGALVGRLREEMTRGGPIAAITVCRDEAQTITARVAREHGVAIGRTSHRLRNAANEPPAWARDLVAKSAGRRATDVREAVIDLGDRVGVLRPIGTIEMCTGCHGPAPAIAPEVREAIARAYPNDQATGFAPGDLRGWMWAEVKKP